MSVTIRDIARELGIDASTVSSCLAGNYKSRRISDARAVAVCAKAAEMGYIPNRLAGRIFGRSKRKNVALVFKNDTAGARTLPVLDYAIRRLGERKDCDFSVLYARTGGLEEALKNGIGLGIRDFIVIGYLRGVDLTAVDFKTLPEIRIYATDYYFDKSDREFPVVAAKIGFDREAFYRDLTAKIESAGFGPVLRAYAVEEGQEAPEDARGLVYRVSEIGDLFAFGATRLAPMIEANWRAGFCRTVLLRNDSMAVGAIAALLARGVRIPDDLAIIGFNNSPFAAYAPVPLSTVDVKLTASIEAVLAHLLEEKPLPREIRTAPHLVWRASTPSELAESKSF